jgi:hypothetical protein
MRMALRLPRKETTMLKTTFAALAVITATLVVAPATMMASAHAGTVICDGPCDEGGGEGGGGGTSSQPPSSKEDGGSGHGGSGGSGGDLTPVTAEQHLAQLEKTCNDALLKLTPIPVSLVKAFSPDGSVSVIGVCNSGLGHKASIDGSQAQPLQAAIAANPAMAGALRAQGFHAEDVVGIVVSNDVATLYVHRAV